MNIKAALSWAQEQLLASDSPRLDAELLLAFVLKKDRAHVIAHDDEALSFWQHRTLKQLLRQRQKNVPMAYLLGSKEFYGLDFEVSSHVLIPRPDTEVMVTAVLDYIQPGDILLDVGSGSGCIPIAVLKNQKGVNAVATDVSRLALHMAERNAKRHEVFDRITFIHSNLLNNVDVDLFDGKRLILTANLPYVPLDYQVNEEAKYEPGLALYAQKNGLDLYQKLLDQLGAVKPRAIFLECYDFQLATLAEHLEAYELVSHKNTLGQGRMLLLERKGE